MSSKWRALQHRHRYTYDAVVFPQSYIDSLDQLPMDGPLGKFHLTLKELVSLTSTYAQIDHVKKVTAEFSSLLVNGQEVFVSQAATIYLEILFFENSVSLHKALVLVLAKKPKFSSLVGNCLRLLFEDYGGAKGKGKRFCASRVALSIMSSPKLVYLVDVVEKCAMLVAMDVVCGLKSAVSETNDGSRPSPLVMEQCQEALSCIYYLLQRFPSRFGGITHCDSDMIPQDFSNLDMIMSTVLSILKSSAFSRDSLVAAGVAFCAALQVCLSPEELCQVIIENIFHKKNLCFGSCSENKLKDGTLKVSLKWNLYSEIEDLSPLSRLCLIRGILTAISRTVLNAQFVVLREANSFSAEPDTGIPVWTILYDGVFPELCNYCENPTDSHSNFHALTVMQICLQQIKTSILTDIGKAKEKCGLISEDMGARILSIIWNNLEDSLSQTVKQVHMVFDLFLEIQSSLHWSVGSDKVKLDMRTIASKLLQLGPRCKGRYVPLSLLTKRLGAKDLLDMSPKLLLETIDAYNEDDVCCAATTFLKCFLECLRDECWSVHGIENGYAEYRNHCLPPVLFGLASESSKLRSNLNTYALPVLLELDVDAIFPMLAFISIGLDAEETELTYPGLNCVVLPLREEQQVAVSVSLLKVSRSLGLIEGDIDWYSSCLRSHEGSRKDADDFAVLYMKGVKIKILVKWLIAALTHVDESLRIDAAESLFLNPKTSSLPSCFELTLMKEAVPLNMRCSTTAFQMKWTSLFRKFFCRVKTSLEKQIKQGIWTPVSSFNNSELSPSNKMDETVNKAEDLFSFMKWLSSFLFFSCYPSAPYERKIMAMELLMIMLNVWSVIPSVEENCVPHFSAPDLYPYSRSLTLPGSTLLLVGSVIDSWDRLRESSFRILLHFPTPLPGISSVDMVKEVIMWAKILVCSPRVRESDAGALTLRLIFRKYVIELGWIVRPATNFVYAHSHLELLSENDLNNHCKSPVLQYVKSLIDWLHMAVEEAENDLSEACKKSFVHGILLALRYTFEELEWGSISILCNISDMRIALEKLLELIMQITSLALCVVSADAWYLPGDMDDMGEDDVFLPNALDEMGSSLSAYDCGVQNSKSGLYTGPIEQIVMVGCWLAMKEVSLLLGTIIRKIPLPTLDGSNNQGPVSVDDDDSLVSSDSVLNLKQLETIGNHFLEVLLKMKHNGAIDKTRAGFTALCNRLLCSNDPRLCKLTEDWMDQLMERTVTKGQTVDDLLRRSAGIPAAFIALFLSEPEGTPKKLLPKALRWLLDVATKSLCLTEERTWKKGSNIIFSNISNETNISTPSPDINVNGTNSKVRDEGVVPTVHAFNVLRAAFNDTNLAIDTSGFSAEAIIISIRSFSSSHWEVRNSACLAYTALVRRMIGFLNVRKRESARRALTGLEFFHRYPLLHTFLLDELKVATELLGDEDSRCPDSNLANHLHPSLCPILILLSRLKPSSMTNETGDTLDPFIFMPFIRRCSIQNNYKVRVLASRALVGVVSNEKLHTVLLNIALELPTEASQTLPSFNSIHGALLQLTSLLATNCCNIVDCSKKDQIIGDLFQVLGSKSWIGSPKSCHCPTLNGSFLKVLDHILSIARSYSTSKNIVPVCNALRDLSSECLGRQIKCGQPYYDPTVIELHKQATSSYLSCFFQVSKEREDKFVIPDKCSPSASHLAIIPDTGASFSTFSQTLVSLMSNASYEVRTVTLKWFFLFLKDADHVDFSNWIGTNFQETLMNLLAAEKNRKCVSYILRILFTWNLQISGEFQHFGNMDYDSVLTFWNNLVSLYKSTRHAKTREALICCMGICVMRFSFLFASSTLSTSGKASVLIEPGQCEQVHRLYECVEFYTSLIQQHSSSSEPLNMRMAVAESLAASGLLEHATLFGSSVFNRKIPSEHPSVHFETEEAVNHYTLKLIDLWFTCIKLLEDEDVGLRRRLASNVQKCFRSKHSGEFIQTAMVPSQVEKVIEMCFEHLSSTFSEWVPYYNYLCGLVLKDASYVMEKGDLVRRVFDKEIDNHHEEKLLICQICCCHLEKFPISKILAEFSDQQAARTFLYDWRSKFMHQVLQFSGDCRDKEGQSSDNWIGGAGNHKDAFLPMYGNLLGFHTLSCAILNCYPETGKPMLADVVQLGEMINPFLQNPLILGLYSNIIKRHERTIDESANDHLLETSWDGFDPYFLVR
ncbi:thyroid adenoma-associated protein homolog [Impatiens glandulifera]|uniref:thyroid adenoma-associated protein homolog n=1 Tax=Impatiens glandulifera TaxID=253017 RepID=UPI001FB19524|nr:thyroid adenoma-associated protein homolog [Impatiens glandulifera]